MDCSTPGSPAHGTLQTRIPEWVTCPPPGELSDSRIEPTSLASPAWASRFFTTSTTWEALIVHWRLKSMCRNTQKASSLVNKNFLPFSPKNIFPYLSEAHQPPRPLRPCPLWAQSSRGQIQIEGALLAGRRVKEAKRCETATIRLFMTRKASNFTCFDYSSWK